MRSFFRISLAILSVIGVSVLGYHAYSVYTDTLRFPFFGQETQTGDILRLVVAKPNFSFSHGVTDIFDRDAISGSLLYDGKPWISTVSAENQLTISGEYLELRTNNKDKIHVRLDADIYNRIKKTQYRLPRSIELIPSDIPSGLDISSIGFPRDRIFQVDMYGYSGLQSSDIRWYMHNDVNKNCDVANVWDSRVFTQLKVHPISTDSISQIEHTKYEVMYDTKLPRVCIIAGIQGSFLTVVDRRLDSFTSTSSIVSVLSPELDLQSEVAFHFSHDIFTDSGSLYSDEYIENRRQQKLSILKALDISPNIPITEDNIILTPSRVSIIGSFQEGIPYKIGIRGISDTYGRILDTTLALTPKSEPFLSIAIPSRRTMFRYGETIDAKLYALKTPKTSYTLKLCRISLEGYARTEKILTEGGSENIDSIYSLFDSIEDTYDCTKKDISLTKESFTNFRLQDMQEDGVLEPGLYILAPKEKEVALSFSKVVLPRVFSVVDTQITMKVDASGKMLFLATDINTGAPRINQSIILKKNIIRTYSESWDTLLQRSMKTYLPFTNLSFSTGIVLGMTKGDGTLDAKKDQLIQDEYSPPYGLMYEGYGDYEGRYQSFIATSTGGGHFGYVVSTWNDGITGWNFGLKDSDYSWDNRSPYSAYIHTDRRLYLPGEKVYIHAIMRENNAKLTIPKDTNFIVKISDPLGTEVKNILLKPNNFGTISFDFDIPKNAHLGSYTIQIGLDSDNAFPIDNAYTYFQVEVFKNPTFTADIRLKSDNIENDVILNLRKSPNLDALNPWYKDVYRSTFAINGIVHARYYNGSQMRGIPFSYRIYRSPYYDTSYWNDCFWGCSVESIPEFYTEGTGSIGSDGMGIFRADVGFESFYNDYLYTVELTITDPMTGESIVTPSTILARVPAEYKAFDLYNPLFFTPEKKIITPGDTISGTLSFQYGEWDMSMQSRYQYQLIHREYVRTLVDDLRIRDMAITDMHDSVILSGSIMGTGLSLSTEGLPAGEYHIIVQPYTKEGIRIPDTSISDTIFYITGNFVDKNANLRVIPEKTIYHHGDIAKVLFTSPFTGGYLYITQERSGVMNHEYVYLTGNTLIREYTIDDSFYPNVYLGAVAFATGYTYGNRNYAVGYGEIITDLSYKKANLQVVPDKKIYKNGEAVNLDIKMTSRDGSPLAGEVAIMVVDESLIRLMGNVDLDIIPKFFRKAPFTMKTALTFIGMEKNRFLSRKGSNGGSGDKGGGGISLSSRSVFKNTAYYNPVIATDSSGKARVSFTLPDNVTDYRIIAIGQTQASQFAVSQDTINVRKDYTIEPHIPYIAYSGDVFQVKTHVFNSTKKVTNATLYIEAGTGSSLITKEKVLFLQPFSDVNVDIDFTVPVGWKGDVPIVFQLRENNKTLDRITKTISIPDIPSLGDVSREFGILTATQSIISLRPVTPGLDIDASDVSVTFSRTPLTHPTASIQSLISYPYGCIEQTISSTLPNILAIRYASLLGQTIDLKSAQKNLDTGLEKILRMQLDGGWKYWETDSVINPHITPYVIRSLFEFRSLGVEIPQGVIDAGLKNIIESTEYQSATSQDPDFLAEIFVTLAQARHPMVEKILPRMEELRIRTMENAQNLSSFSGSVGFSRHGLLMYAQGLQYISKISPDILKDVEKIMISKQNDSPYWYWSYDADKAIYARLLLSLGDRNTAGRLLADLAKNVDMYSYYTSTQTKIQIFLALIEYSRGLKDIPNINLSLRSDGITAQSQLNTSKLSIDLTAPRSVFSDNIEVSLPYPIPEIFYEIIQTDIPKDILLSRPKSAGITVSRIFEKIDESKGMDLYGRWIVSEKVTNNKFQKEKLYRVTLTVNQSKSVGKKYYLALEDFFPGGWRPIRGIFDIESIATKNKQQGSMDYPYWSHIEARNDRILATMDFLESDKPQTYVYYIRPEYTGKYLLPPVIAYYMYNPDIHAIGKYEQVFVTD